MPICITPSSIVSSPRRCEALRKDFEVKEAYFTPENLERKSQEMLQDLGLPSQRRSLPFVPERSALLILDVQSYFLEESSHAFVPSARAILPGIRRLCAAFSRRGLPVIFTRHLNAHLDAGLMSVWWSELITADNPLSQIIPELDLSNATVLVKSQYDAFYRTPLEQLLHRAEISQVVISGVMTHLCCETTARSAFVRGFEVFFLVDGTATYNGAFHRASLLNLAHGFASLVFVREILSALEPGHAD